MLLLKCLLAVVLLASCSLAAAEAVDVEAHQAAVAAARKEAEEARAERSADVLRCNQDRDAALAKLKAAEAASRQAAQAVDGSKKTIDDLNRKIKQLEADVSTQSRKTKDLQAQLAKAQVAAASGDELQQLLRQAQDSWLPLWMQYRLLQTQGHIVQLLEDLKRGKHGALGSKLHTVLDAANQHATKAFVIVKPHMDKGYAAASHHAGKAYEAAKPHVEDGLAKLSVVLDKARVKLEAHWKKYVTDAEWWHEAKAAYAKVEKELVSVVSKQMREIPALKPYSDPVTVQLLVYAIFLVPALVITVPLLALGCSRPSSAAKDTQKRKPEKAKPGAHAHAHHKRPKRA